MTKEHDRKWEEANYKKDLTSLIEAKIAFGTEEEKQLKRILLEVIRDFVMPVNPQRAGALIKLVYKDELFAIKSARADRAAATRTRTKKQLVAAHPDGRSGWPARGRGGRGGRAKVPRSSYLRALCLRCSLVTGVPFDSAVQYVKKARRVILVYMPLVQQAGMPDFISARAEAKP